MSDASVEKLRADLPRLLRREAEALRRSQQNARAQVVELAADELAAMRPTIPDDVGQAVERLGLLYEQLWLAAKIGGTLTPRPEQADDLRTILDALSPRRR